MKEVLNATKPPGPKPNPNPNPNPVKEPVIVTSSPKDHLTATKTLPKPYQSHKYAPRHNHIFMLLYNLLCRRVIRRTTQTQSSHWSAPTLSRSCSLLTSHESVLGRLFQLHTIPVTVPGFLEPSVPNPNLNPNPNNGRLDCQW